MNYETNQTLEKLAGSLTAETTELIPFLPYLLQDIWELGSKAEDMIRLITGNININSETKVIDLGCGKGAVSVALSKALGIRVTGIDLLADFIKVAEVKAEEYGVKHLCDFTVQDINESVKTARGYDIAVLGAVGDVLGEPKETLCKLRQVVRSNGYILLDEAYLTGDRRDVKYQNYEYLTLAQWKKLFLETDLELIAEINCDDDGSADKVNEYNNRMIKIRADELSEQYPDKRRIFEEYVESQQKECDDLDETIVGVTWLLKRL